LGGEEPRMILHEIVAKKREKRAAFTPIDSTPRPLVLRPGLKIIAEFKRKSPSAGAIRPGADVTEIARAYERAGAAALSVLTDGDFFDGSPADLQRARAAVQIPVLRKDFLLDEADVVDSRRMGADLVLLIVRILDDATLRRMLRAAQEQGMQALVETHSDAEIDRALGAGAGLIGVNHRDLDTLKIDLSLSSRARSKIGERLLVAESGIQTPADVQRMRAHGADAILVGERLMRAPDPGQALEQLCS
jgi:indole-3-glycerol phosphate synthase